MANDEFIKKVLKLTAEYDHHDSLYWNSNLKFYVKCNDVFWWGTGDLEEITHDDINDLEQALKNSEDEGFILFAARKRNLRPQGAYYNLVNKKDRTLLNACGPKREIELCNPYPNPDDDDNMNTKEASIYLRSQTNKKVGLYDRHNNLWTFDGTMFHTTSTIEPYLDETDEPFTKEKKE